MFARNDMLSSKFKIQSSKLSPPVGGIPHNAGQFKVQNFKGFTLIELLVVITVIAILIGFGVSRYSVAEKQTRDARRKSDLNQFKIALESYSSANSGIYPVACADTTTLCATNNFDQLYLGGNCIADPRPTLEGFGYQYCGTATDYVLWGSLESGDYYEYCSNGRTGKVTTDLSSKTTSTCDITD